MNKYNPKSCVFTFYLDIFYISFMLTTDYMPGARYNFVLFKWWIKMHIGEILFFNFRDWFQKGGLWGKSERQESNFYRNCLIMLLCFVIFTSLFISIYFCTISNNYIISLYRLSTYHMLAFVWSAEYRFFHFKI